MRIREAVSADAEALSQVLEELRAAGKRKKAGDPAFVQSHYIAGPGQVRCSVAEDADGTLLGLQSLKRAWAGNPYDTPVGWGIIGTHIRPSAARRGVGRALFAASQEAARQAGLRQIEAAIGDANAEGLAYYAAMGFETYAQEPGLVRKCFTLS